MTPKMGSRSYGQCVSKRDSRTNFEHPSALFCNSIRVAKKTHWEPQEKNLQRYVRGAKLGLQKKQENQWAHEVPHAVRELLASTLCPLKKDPQFGATSGNLSASTKRKRPRRIPQAAKHPQAITKMHDNCNTVKQENSSHAKKQIQAIKTTTKTQQHEMN